MSDNQPSEIETIKAQVAALADPKATFDQISAGIGDLWNAAEARGSEQEIAYLQAVWNNVTALHQGATTANMVAAAALQTAVEMATAASESQAAFETLNERLPDLIEEAYESGREDEGEAIFERLDNSYNGECYFENPGEEVVLIWRWEQERELPPDHEPVKPNFREEHAAALVRYLCGHTPPLGKELADYVGKLIAAFGKKYDATVEAQTAEAHQRRDELMKQLNIQDTAATN